MLAGSRTTYALKRYALIRSDFLLRHHGYKWDHSVAMQLTALCTYVLCTKVESTAARWKARSRLPIHDN